MLRPSVRHGTALAAGLVAGVLVAVGGVALRLSQGPIAANVFKPAVERLLAAQAPGGRATVGEVQVVWFGPARAIGLELGNVLLVDGQGRTVLEARRFEAGLAADSLLTLRPAAGRIAADDFFAAVSVSPQGRYALGYDAAGAPRRAENLWRAFDDLTGRPRFGRPLSFLREVALSRGELALRQVGGPVDWTGRITNVRLSKASGALAADVDVTVGPASLKASARGLVGLKRAAIKAGVAGFDPARLFPTVGPTAFLAAFDAPVQGGGFLSWAADRGVRAADVALTAGPGRVLRRDGVAAFRSGALHAAFDPQSRRVLIQTAHADSDAGAFDGTGEVWLVPESRASGPARVEAAISVPKARLALASGAALQPVSALSLRAGYTPATGRIVIAQAGAELAGARFSASGDLQRPRDPRSWGVDVSGRLDGMMDAHALLAMWPDRLSDDARTWLVHHIQAGQLGRLAFALRLRPGDVQPHRPMPRERVRLAYAFDNLSVLIDPSLPAVERARGTGLLQGDSLELQVRSASMQGVGLGEGQVKLPRLVGDHKIVEVSARAVGDARQILQVVDRATSGVTTGQGFAPDRVSGQGDVAFDVKYPIDDSRPLKGQDVTYDGRIRSAVIQDAVIGMSLRSASVQVQGSLDHLSAQGEVRLGPYRGPLEFATSFPEHGAAAQRALFDGVLDGSGLGLGGSQGSQVRFLARVESQAGAGHATIRSKAFDGQTTWSSSRGGRFSAQGMIDTAALRSIGLPVGKGLPGRMPARLGLTHGAAGWTGALEADAYSGAIAYTPGQTRRLRYVAELTPGEAQKLGLDPAPGGRNQPLSVDLAENDDDSGQAAYALGTWTGQVSWAAPAGGRVQYRWRTTLSPAQLHALGLPAGIEPRAPLPVDVALTPSGGGWSGTAQVMGGALKFASEPGGPGRRKLTVTGQVDGGAAAQLGLWPEGTITGPAGVSASLDLGAGGVRGGRLELDLQRAGMVAPFVTWKKPAGRAMRISADFDRRTDGAWEALAIKGRGPGFGLDGKGEWRGPAGGELRLAVARLEGAFDGSLDLAVDADGRRLSTRARYFDARRLIQQGGGSATGADAAPRPGRGRPLHIEAQIAQARVGEQSMVRNVRIRSDLGDPAGQQTEVVIAGDDGESLVVLRLFPDAGGVAIAGEVSDVGRAAQVLFDRDSFRGGQAVVSGRLVAGGADLQVDMTKVRLVRASALARILTVGSLHGMADTLNGAGIEFTKVTAPVSIRGAKLIIERARATGPAMGVTTQGVIDVDNHTVDLSGGIAPSYVLNSAIGAVPVVGDLLISHKGEGMFGLTYSAKGAFDAPRINVNPFSLATPGILRRIFEGRSAAARAEQGG